MKIEDLYSVYKQCTGVTTDSRSSCTGALFFALRGDSYDGNQYVQSALAAGCIAAVVDDVALKDQDRCYYVIDVLETLQELAKRHRRELRIPVIGITGTNGKTSTKELMAAVLSQSYLVAYTQGNLNNHIGVPLTILSMNQKHDIAIVEMGANHIGEIAFLCEIAQPTCGLITNVGRAHLAGFGSFEGVIQAKSELYHYLKAHDRDVFVNGSNPLLLKLSEGMNRNCYLGDESFVTGQLDDSSLFVRLFWNETNWDQRQELNTKLVGICNFENILAAIAVGLYFDVSPNKINEAIEAYAPGNHRSQLVKTLRNDVVLDAYNANPSSMEQAIQHFAKHAGSVLILGAMKELGSASYQEHLTLLKDTQSCSFKKIYVLGAEFCTCRQELTAANISFFETKEALESALKDDDLHGETILVKGSRSMKMETLLNLL